MPKKESALDKAVRLAGGQSELKRKLEAAGEEISQAAISLWFRSGLPERWALPVARVIDFQVTPHELHRKQYPNPWDGLPLDRARPLLEIAA